MPVICTVGLFGNLVSVIVVFMSKRLTGNAFVYIKWMTVTNFSIIAEYAIYRIYIKYPEKSWPWALVVYQCYIGRALYNACICVSCLLIAALTVERYLGMCYPLVHRNHRICKSPIVVVGIIFVISFVLHLPHTFDAYITQELDNDTNSTYYLKTDNLKIRTSVLYRYVWQWIKEIVTKILPILIVVLLNPFIIRAHRRSVVRRNEMRIQQSTESKSKDKHVTVLLISLSIMFVSCILPYTTLWIVSGFLSKPQIISVNFRIFLTLCLALIALNFSANFYFYAVASAEFRTSFKEVFAGCFKRTQVQPQLIPANT